MREIASIKGLPGMDIYREGIESNMANMAAKGKEAASSGGDYLAYLSSLYGGSNASISNLNAADATQRSRNFDSLAAYKTMLGSEQSRNTAINEARKDDLFKQANDLETAATQNKMIASEQTANAIGSGISGVLGVVGAGYSAYSQYNNNVRRQDTPVSIETKTPSLLSSGVNTNNTGYTNDQGLFVSPEEDTAAINILQSMGVSPTGAQDDIKSIQGFLKGSGFYDGNVDGVYGPETAQAMKLYLNKVGYDYMPQDMSYYYGQSFLRHR